MHIDSPAFEQHAPIPTRYTGDGEDLSPPLKIGGVPDGTKTLVLIVDDPDAPRGHFTHWVVWGIPPQKNSLEEGEKLSHQGVNGFGKVGWGGPSPPPGKAHRYIFTLYALDTALNLPSGSSLSLVEGAMEGHIVAKAQLTGIYQRR